MNFIEYKYKDIGKIRSGKRLKKGYIVSDKKTNNRYIRVRDINNGIIDVNNVQYISDEAASYITRYKVSKNDIIISVVGTVGSVASIPNELDGAYLTENCNNLLVDEKICLKEYLKYFLLSKDGQAEILSHIVGTTQPKLPIYGIEAFNIKIPEKECQNKIIKILNTINNKISLNTQINNNLYEIANSLLQNDFENNTEIELLNNIIKFTKGKKPLNISNKNEKDYIKYLTIACLNNQEIIYANPTKTIISEEDILMVMDGASSGEVYFSDYGVVGSTLAKVDIINENYTKAYIFFILKKYSELIKNKNTGSAIPHTDKAFVNTLGLPIISIEQQLKYKNILNKIQHNNAENINLIKTRDTLLPKLMNGEIDLGKIEI